VICVGRLEWTSSQLTIRCRHLPQQANHSKPTHRLLFDSQKMLALLVTIRTKQHHRLCMREGTHIVTLVSVLSNVLHGITFLEMRSVCPLSRHLVPIASSPVLLTVCVFLHLLFSCSYCQVVVVKVCPRPPASPPQS
jgi:hypothetical protein